MLVRKWDQFIGLAFYNVNKFPKNRRRKPLPLDSSLIKDQAQSALKCMLGEIAIFMISYKLNMNVLSIKGTDAIQTTRSYWEMFQHALI